MKKAIKTKNQPRNHRAAPLTLWPMPPDEALALAMQVKPPKSWSKKKRTKTA